MNMIRALFAIPLFALSCLASVTVPTAHYDNSRTGANTQEVTITPSNVSLLRQTGSYTTDGFVYAQPLYIPGLTVGGNPHTCLIIATMHNTISCFDAATPGAALWSVSLGASYPLASTPAGSFPLSNLLRGTEVGITSTPVADPTNNLLYVVRDTTGPVWTLYKLNLSTGATISSVNIATSGFDPQYQLQRAALTLANGNIYIGFGSYGDVPTWYGWLFAYDASALTQTAVFKTHSTGGAGLWGASGGPSVDGSGNLYMLTGNGTWNGTTNWGESILKWDSTLTLSDWFTPSNWSTLNTNDSDLSSGRAMLVPGTNILVSCAKDYRVYNIDRTDMGHLQGTGTAPQLFPTDPSGVITDHSGCYGGTYINDHAYFPNVGGKIYRFTRTGSTFNTTPLTSTDSYEFPGASMSSSSNGTANTLIWALTGSVSSLYALEPLTLRAFDANLVELFHDSPGGNLSKFSTPVVADGRVYIASQSNLVYVYTLAPTTGLAVGGLLSFGGAVSIGGQGVGGAPNTGYQFRRSITINHLKVPNTDQIDFPVLISGTYPYLATVANGGKVQSLSGDDIVYTADPACNNLLNFQGETWVATSGDLKYWAKIPLVSSTVDTIFYECYGNASISEFQGNIAGTWNSNYDGVFHLGNGVTLSGSDSTGTQDVSLNSTVAATGQIDGGAATTSTHYLSNVDATVYPGANDGPCISIWLKTTQTAHTSVMSYGRDSANNQYYFYFEQFSGADYRVGLGIGAGSIIVTDAQANDGAFHYYVGSVDTGTSTGHIYMDGTLRATGTFSWTLDENFDGLNIGRLASGLQTLTGTVDEARISRNGCSADQVGTEYNNQSSPSTFYTVGAEVPL